MANPIYTPEVPSTSNWKPFTWGVNKVTVAAVEVKLSKKGDGILVTCTLDGEEGRSAQYVSLGWYKDVKTAADQTAFETAVRDYTILKTMRADLYKTSDEAAKATIKTRIDQFYEKIKTNPYTSLARSMDDLVKFVMPFTNGAAIAAINNPTLLGYITDLTNLMVGNTAYAMLMTEQYVNTKNNKVNNRISLSQEFIAPMSFYTNSVKAVTTDYRTVTNDMGEEIGKQITGCTITFDGNRKPYTIKVSDKNMKLIEASTPTDAPNPTYGDESSYPTTTASDDLPF